MSDFVTKEELEGVIAEVRKDIKKIEDRVDTLASVLASPDILQVAEKFLQFICENPEQLSKEELKKIAEKAIKIGEMGKKIKNIRKE
ncbi:MAG: hypothetical protein J7L03_00535 [Caldisericaceae bacterium]|nr:hypothetical protein [Caldisericaceae bacterium]